MNRHHRASRDASMATLAMIDCFLRHISSSTGTRTFVLNELERA
jgi:hypothetical protein